MKNIEIIQILNLLPEVTWDRYMIWENEFSVFGWIDREDHYKDFIVIEFKDGHYESFTTSSARHSKDFYNRLESFLGNPTEASVYSECVRVEYLGWPVKCIKLEEHAKDS